MNTERGRAEARTICPLERGLHNKGQVPKNQKKRQKHHSKWTKTTGANKAQRTVCPINRPRRSPSRTRAKETQVLPMTSSGYFPVVGWDFHFRTVPRVWEKLPKNIFLYDFLNKKLASSPWQQADALNHSSGHTLSHTGHLLSIAPGEKPQMCRDLCVRMFTKWWTIAEEKNAQEITDHCNDTKNIRNVRKLQYKIYTV